MGLENAQGLHHFLTQSPWEASAYIRQRLELILKIVKDRKIIIIIDETGDPKKGKASDLLEPLIALDEESNTNYPKFCYNLHRWIKFISSPYFGHCCMILEKWYNLQAESG